MPTTRPRHILTETDDLADALAVAAEHWSEVSSRALLLRRLALEGASALEAEDQRLRAARRKAVAKTAGAFTGMWEPGELERPRGEWPR